MKDHAPRYENIQRQSRIAGDGDGQHRHGHGVDEAPDLPDSGIQLLEQQCIGIEIEIVGEDHSQPDTEVFHRPAGFHMGIAHHLLDQHQAGNRGPQQPCIQQVNTEHQRDLCPGKHAK